LRVWDWGLEEQEQEPRSEGVVIGHVGLWYDEVKVWFDLKRMGYYD
jgi:hypothetical protein